MEKHLQEITQLLKLPNDSNAQYKLLNLLNEIHELLKKFDKRKITENQPAIEDILFSIINLNKANSDICNRYIFFIYTFIFDNGHASRITELIAKLTSLLTSKKMVNVKATSLWLMGKVCSTIMYKSPHLSDVILTLIKTIKNTSDILIKSESFLCIARLLSLKMPFFYNNIPELLKIILKQEKNANNDTKSKKNILKALNSLIFFLNGNLINQNHDALMSFLNKFLSDEDQSIQERAVNLYVDLHCYKIFDSSINLTRIIRKKAGEQLKNFIEVILFVGNFIIPKNDNPINLKLSYVKILIILLKNNKDFLNSNENLIYKIYDLLTENFKLNYLECNSNFNITSGSKFNFLNSAENFENKINQNTLLNEIEELFRTFIKLIYQSAFRKSLMKHIFKKVLEAQGELDKMENSTLSYSNLKNGKVLFSIFLFVYFLDVKSNSKKKENSVEIKKEKFTGPQVNSILFSLIEYSENNYDIFEITFKNFNEISQALIPYFISPVSSFRMLVNRIFINLAYFIPCWRITMLTIILNFSSVAHAEVAALKNTFIYTIDESSAEFKYALIIRNNLELLKDIANCLSIILTSFSHKHKGVTIDMSNAALSIAKNMIIGKFANEDDDPKSLTILEKAKKFNFSNSDVDSHKEAGWMIIEGLCSMDTTWQSFNFKSLNLLWNFIFEENCCLIEETNVDNIEYREALVSEFFIKKSALSSLRKFILSSKNILTENSNINNNITKHLMNAINFFLPKDQKKTINFLKKFLKEKYKEAKIILYNCFFLIQPKHFVNKFNHLLHFLCEDIACSDYKNYSMDYFNINLNYFDSFMCEKDEFKDTNNEYNTSNTFLIQNYNIDNYNIQLTDKIKVDINSKLVNSAICLLSEILLDPLFYNKNRQSILKYFLTQMNEISINKIDNLKIFKALNISFCLYNLLKKSHEKNIFIINDESLFASSKMIFDIGYKIDNKLLLRISSEGHAYLIKSSSNPQYNLNYYLTALECKFKNETNLDNAHFISTLYMIANIFRINDFANISGILDNYMNFIISYFNKIEDLYNPYISQAIFVIVEVLVKNNKIDHARKMIEVFKLNYLFMNKDNFIYFKELMERNSLTEIKIMLMLNLLNDNLKTNEINLFQLILKKYDIDKKFESLKLKKVFLYLSKSILTNKKLKNFIHNETFLNFLIKNVNETDGKYLHKFSKKIFSLNLIKRFSIEILIYYLINNEKDENSLKEISEKIINSLNNQYNFNNLFHYNKLIFKQIFDIPVMKRNIFDKNNYEELLKISDFINISNNSNHILTKNSERNPILIIYCLIYSNYHLIKLYKVYLKIYFEKKHNQTIMIINMIKDLIQNNTLLHTDISKLKGLNDKSDTLTNSEEKKEENIKNLPLLLIRNLSNVIHISLKVFLTKSLINCLKITLNNIGKISQSNVKNISNTQIYLDFLNHFMSISMVLILSEECWHIKVNGNNLLIDLIKYFSKIKDDRVDDNSLIIQQYEAQINSCIKMIFGNNFSIESLFKGIELLYFFITIPITTDISFVKKIGNYVDIDFNSNKNVSNKNNNNNPGMIFSEKYDHLFLMKKLKFFCKLYITSLRFNKANNLMNMNINNSYDFKSISVFNSKITNFLIFGENLEKNNNLKEYFITNELKLLKIIYDMVNDFHVVLVSDYKFSKHFKDFKYIVSGNRISYSYKKIFTYSQIYLKTVGYILMANRLKENNNTNSEDNNTDNDSIDIFSYYSYDKICELVLFHIYHFSLKSNFSQTQNNLTGISDLKIYSTEDLNFEVREKIVLNTIKIKQMLEILFQILFAKVKISKEILFLIINYISFLNNFCIKEFDNIIIQITEMIIFYLKKSDCDYTKEKDIQNSNNISKENLIDLTEPEKNFIFDYLFKIAFNYLKRYRQVMFIDNSYSKVLINLINIFTKIFSAINLNSLSLNNKENTLTSTLNNLMIILDSLLTIFTETKFQDISKLIASSLYSLLNEISKLKILKLFLDKIFECCRRLENFEKFYILNLLVLQNITKLKLKNNSENKIEQNDQKFIDYSIKKLFNFLQFLFDAENFNSYIHKKNKKNKVSDKIIFSVKFLALAFQRNVVPELIRLIENFFVFCIDKKIFSFLILFEDFENLLINFLLRIDNSEKRKNFVLIILFLLNEQSMVDGNVNIRKYSEVAIKVLSKDSELIGGVVNFFDRSFIKEINNLIEMAKNKNKI